jgi:hypothetical protein
LNYIESDIISYTDIIILAHHATDGHEYWTLISRKSILSKLAIKIFAITPHTMSIERMFSRMGKQNTPQRSSLNPFTQTKLARIKDNLLRSQPAGKNELAEARAENIEELNAKWLAVRTEVLPDSMTEADKDEQNGDIHADQVGDWTNTDSKEPSMEQIDDDILDDLTSSLRDLYVDPIEDSLVRTIRTLTTLKPTKDLQAVHDTLDENQLDTLGFLTTIDYNLADIASVGMQKTFEPAPLLTDPLPTTADPDFDISQLFRS